METHLKMRTLIILFVVIGIGFSCQTANYKLNTPLEDKNYTELSYSDEISLFLQKASTISNYIHVEQIGNSEEQRPIWAVKISKNSDIHEKTKVLFFAQQHGNEASGKEGMLIFIKKMALGKIDYLLDSLDIFIIPQLNPDGGDRFVRRNAKGIDLNRDHVLLESAETQVFHKYFNTILPHVAVDIHEYYPYSKAWEEFGFFKQFDEQIGTMTNTNIDNHLMALAKNEILPYAKQFLEYRNYSFFEYTVGSLAHNERLRHSTVDINDGRQSTGIQNTLSVIIEGLNGLDSLENIKHRSEGQYIASLAITDYVFKNASKVKAAVNKARADLNAGQPEKLSIRMEHLKGEKPLNYPLHNIETGKDSVFEVVEYHSRVVSLLDINKPKAYLIPSGDSLLVSIMNKHQMKYKEYEQDDNDLLIAYHIHTRDKVTVEELYTFYPIVERMGKVSVQQSYFYVPTNQLKGNMLVLILEPQSTLGLVNYNKFNYLLHDQVYSILRVE